MTWTWTCVRTHVFVPYCFARTWFSPQMLKAIPEVDTTLPRCPRGLQALWTTAISHKDNLDVATIARRWRRWRRHRVLSYSHFWSRARSRSQLVPALCPGSKEWEDNRWMASAFFHHSQNVPPVTFAPAHQRDNDIQTPPREVQTEKPARRLNEDQLPLRPLCCWETFSVQNAGKYQVKLCFLFPGCEKEPPSGLNLPNRLHSRATLWCSHLRMLATTF